MWRGGARSSTAGGRLATSGDGPFPPVPATFRHWWWPVRRQRRRGPPPRGSAAAGMAAAADASAGRGGDGPLGAMALASAAAEVALPAEVVAAATAATCVTRATGAASDARMDHCSRRVVGPYTCCCGCLYASPPRIPSAPRFPPVSVGEWRTCAQPLNQVGVAHARLPLCVPMHEDVTQKEAGRAHLSGYLFVMGEDPGKGASIAPYKHPEPQASGILRRGPRPPSPTLPMLFRNTPRVAYKVLSQDRGVPEPDWRLSLPRGLSSIATAGAPLACRCSRSKDRVGDWRRTAEPAPARRWIDVNVATIDLTPISAPYLQ